MAIFSSKSVFIWSANADGLAVRIDSPKLWQQAQNLKAPPNVQRGYRRMQMLAECGEAEVRDVDCGVFISTEDAVRIDDATRELFDLPAPWPGGMRLMTESVPNLPGFVARLGLVDPLAGVDWSWRLRGPILETAGIFYLPTTAQFASLQAFKEWQTYKTKDEISNLSLLASLREAHDSGCLIDLEAYRESGTDIVRAEEIVVNAVEDPASGDLILCPLPLGGFPAISVEEMEQRLTQLDGSSPRKVVRVGKTIILLDDEQSELAGAVRKRPRVPKSERNKYEDDPAGWLAENVFPDVSFEFSPRVIGIGEWQGGYMGAANGDPEDWFGAKPEAEKKNPERDHDEKADDGADESPPEVKPSVLHPLIIPNDTELGYGWAFDESGKPTEESYEPDFSRYQRKPMPHQEEAIRWLLGHARRALKHKEIIPEQKAWGAGALLADDMGLGKSFTTLIALAEWIRHWRDVTGTEPPAMLFVVPLSLMENWCSEIEATFGDQNGPFLRIVMAQPDFELHRFRRSPGAIDVAEPGHVNKFGLCFGDDTERSLDLPGSCVITTYQTLRDYRFSFAAANWGAAIFDEAQHIKNPNAQQTIAAKALRALFRITLTGTPVENHLGDFWCILDTAEPGPLGSFSDFRKSWIAPMNRDRNRMQEIGRELRAHVGGLMLRRTKEEELKGLPGKSIIPVACSMSIEQELLYAEARGAVNHGDPSDEGAAKGRHLAALWHLRQISLHPDLVGGGSLPVGKTEAECRRILCRSGKLAWLLDKLDEIRSQGEKTLIFCVLKDLQQALSAHLEIIYGIGVPIINGDTKATSRRDPSTTRLGLIRTFSERPGFGLCVLSPIAAGAGLNIVAANHVIHLERHWNPAKEDQATDRAYRIGQNKPVTVYLPASRHSEFPSFDSILDNLLRKKRSLQSSLGLVPPDSVSAPDLIAEVFGQTSDRNRQSSEPLTLEGALHLSWQMFEALIALLYEQESQRVILTPQSADHGADVVVLGWGEKKENILIQCKFTARRTLDSEEGVRAVCSSAPFFEGPLGVTFGKKRLHCTAQNVSKRSRRSAEICAVEILKRDWLQAALIKHRPTLGQVLDREGRREKVS